jgi:hypothetical protein
MTLIVGKRHKIVDADLDYSSVAESDANDGNAWNSATAYVIGNVVRRVTTNFHFTFECIRAHTDQDPAISTNVGTTGFWVLKSPTQRWRPFDDNASTSPDNASFFYFWRMKPTRAISHIAIINGVAESTVVANLNPFVTRVNFVDESEAFGNATYWTPVALDDIDPDVDRDPIYDLWLMDDVIEDSATSQHGLNAVNNRSYTSGTAYTISIYADRLSFDPRNLRLILPSTAFGANVHGNFTLTGAGTAAASGGASVAITSIGGMYRCSVTATATATVSASQGQIRILDNSLNVSYTGDALTGLRLFGFQNNNGALATYQPVINGVDYTRTVLKEFLYTFPPDEDKRDSGPINPTFVVECNNFPSQFYEISVTQGVSLRNIKNAEVGEIVFLYDSRELGTLIQPLDDSLLDFSAKTRDDFGNITLIQRAAAEDINYTFTIDTSRRVEIKTMLKERLGQPLVFFEDEDLDNDLGVFQFGFINGYSMPALPAGVQIVSLDTEGLI